MDSMEVPKSTSSGAGRRRERMSARRTEGTVEGGAVETLNYFQDAYSGDSTIYMYHHVQSAFANAKSAGPRVPLSGGFERTTHLQDGMS